MNESFDFPATELRSVKPGRGSSNKSAVKNGVATFLQRRWIASDAAPETGNLASASCA
jgi:hypothetical protein